MEFRISDTFTASLGRLRAEEQGAAKGTAMDLQINPSDPALQMHRIEKARDPGFWSVRVNLDIRLIVHRSEGSVLLCYLGHHDEAYRWAARRRLETHPKTGAAQLVEIRETVQEIVIPRYVERKPLLFADISESELLGYGVPQEWIADVRKADEDSLLVLAGHLPGEAAEALLDLATGSRPKVMAAVAGGGDPFAHPDAQRRFRTMKNAAELERALEWPWEQWIVFLHPAQQKLVEREYQGPARVSGSAGTGKTIVALHRAAALARKHPDARILLTTFSEPLANALRWKLGRLLGKEPLLGERVEVHSMEALAKRLYRAHFGGGEPKLATRAEVDSAILGAAADRPFALPFLRTEWLEMVDARRIGSWEVYRDAPRLGMKTRLTEAKRLALWEIFAGVRKELAEQGLQTEASLFALLTEKVGGLARSPFDFAVVDEAQDVSVPQLRFLAALGRNRKDALYFAGDSGQRIFQSAFSWKALGVDIRGRSANLRVNYRTSHQIRSQADRLLGETVVDADGNVEERKGTVSIFNGPAPWIGRYENAGLEEEAVAAWLRERVTVDRFAPQEIAVFVRSEKELKRAGRAIRAAGLVAKVLDEGVEVSVGSVAAGAMHLAKGLEFRAVAVMACDDEVLPSTERIRGVGDHGELAEVYESERRLLYVACTRARDCLMVSGVRPVSEFVDDLADGQMSKKAIS